MRSYCNWKPITTALVNHIDFLRNHGQSIAKAARSFHNDLMGGRVAGAQPSEYSHATPANIVKAYNNHKRARDLRTARKVTNVPKVTKGAGKMPSLFGLTVDELSQAASLFKTLKERGVIV